MPPPPGHYACVGNFRFGHLSAGVIAVAITSSACAGAEDAVLNPSDSDATVDAGTGRDAEGRPAISGFVSGLIGAVMLENNGAERMRIDVNGPFVLLRSVSDGDRFDIVVVRRGSI